MNCVKKDKMTYDWEGKKDFCYQMFVVDKKSLEDIREFYRETEDFTPRYIPQVDSFSATAY